MSVSITEAESKILSLLWEQSPLTVAEITAALREKTGWDRHSVISLLKRMQAKGNPRAGILLWSTEMRRGLSKPAGLWTNFSTESPYA